MSSSATVSGSDAGSALPGAELRPRPGDGGQRVAVERVVGTPDRRRVVVAEHDDRAVRRVALDQVEHRHRIGAVADEVAEKRVSVRAQRVRVREAGGDRLEVAVDIGEQGELHRGPPVRVVRRSCFWMRYPTPRTVTISTPAASSFLRNRCT